MLNTTTINPSTTVDKSEAAAVAAATASYLNHDASAKIKAEEDAPLGSKDNPAFLLSDLQLKKLDAEFSKENPPVVTIQVHKLDEAFSTADENVAPPSDTMSVGLREPKQKELEDYETIIDRGLKTFVEVGTALGSIRDNGLFLPKYESFEKYVDGRWHFTKQRASQLIQAADGHKILSARIAEKKIPKTERAMREILKAPEDKRAEILDLAANNGEPTAESIASARKSVMPKKAAKAKPKRKQPVKWEKAIKGATQWAEYLSNIKKSQLSDEQREEMKKVEAEIEQNFIKLKLAA